MRHVAALGTVSATELAGTLGVSGITIRRDLDELQNEGLIERVRGGARRRRPQGPEPPILQRQAAQAPVKRAIGQAAVDLVAPEDVIALESGSTTLELAYAIANRKWTEITVLTNSFPIAQVLTPVPNVRVIFLGGLVDPNELASFGVLTEAALRIVRIDKLFIGCRGLDPEVGVTSDIGAEREVATARAMVAVSSQVIVVADHEKFGRTFLLQVIEPEVIDVVVTDSAAPVQYVSAFRKRGKLVVTATTPAGDPSVGRKGSGAQSDSSGTARRRGDDR